jgi:hypothetical protein
MPVKYVSVKAVPGRLAFTAPRGGASIPHDTFVEVEETNYIRRLIDFHGDLVEQPVAPVASAKTKKAAKPDEGEGSVL